MLQVKEERVKEALKSVSSVGDISYQVNIERIKEKIYVQTHDLEAGPFSILVIADEKTRANILMTPYTHKDIDLITLRFSYPEGVKAIVKKFIYNLFMEGFEVGTLVDDCYSPWSPESMGDLETYAIS